MENLNLMKFSTAKTVALPLDQNSIFIGKDRENNEILKLCENEDIFVKGRLAENDKEVVDALREFLKSM
jgi:hypothetical protein